MPISAQTNHLRTALQRLPWLIVRISPLTRSKLTLQLFRVHCLRHRLRHQHGPPPHWHRLFFHPPFLFTPHTDRYRRPEGCRDRLEEQIFGEWDWELDTLRASKRSSHRDCCTETRTVTRSHIYVARGRVVWLQDVGEKTVS
jgi:hypothetical protein